MPFRRRLYRAKHNLSRSQQISKSREGAKVWAQVIATGILEGLVVLDERGIGHRDIKSQVTALLTGAHTELTFNGRTS